VASTIHRLHRINQNLPQKIIAAFARQREHERTLDLPAKLQSLSIRPGIKWFALLISRAAQRLLKQLFGRPSARLRSGSAALPMLFSITHEEAPKTFGAAKTAAAKSNFNLKKRTQR